jgi:hypothetical protein
VGHKDEARKTLSSLLRFNPDDAVLQAMLRDGSYAGQHCALEP